MKQFNPIWMDPKEFQGKRVLVTSGTKGGMGEAIVEQLIAADMQELLAVYHDDGKEPAAMAKGMEWFKTNITLAVEDSDAAVADFITEGCHMGVKSLARYLNQYKAADEKSKDITKRLIREEDELAVAIRLYL